MHFFIALFIDVFIFKRFESPFNVGLVINIIFYPKIIRGWEKRQVSSTVIRVSYLSQMGFTRLKSSLMI